MGIGVSPTKMNINVSHPSMMRNQPRGTRSLAVGGCRVPINQMRMSIAIQT